MSDVSMGPGWWIASDGRWYPPHLHPNALAGAKTAPLTAFERGPDPAVINASPTAASAPYATGAPPTPWTAQSPHEPVADGLAGAQQARSKKAVLKKRLVFVAIVIAVLGAIGGVLYIVVGRSSSNSAQAVASTAVADMQSGRFSQVCTSALPAQASKCQGDVRQLSSAIHQASSTHVSLNIRLGTVTTSGNRALAVITGTICAGPQHCVSNHDPNAAMDGGHTFDQMYASATSSSSSGSQFVMPLVERGGTWYLTGF